jgi:hypothetical protein
MSELAQRANRRGSRRHLPRGKIRVLCRKGALDLGKSCALLLLDVSETGVRLVLTEQFRKGTEVYVTLEGISGRLARRVGTVMWSLAAADGSFVTGVHFQKVIRYAELGHFARC